MNAADRAQVHQVLLGRRHAIADDWHRAIARTGFVPFKAAEVRQRLVQLVPVLKVSLLPLDPSPAARQAVVTLCPGRSSGFRA